MLRSLFQKSPENVTITTKSIANEPRKQPRTTKPWRPVTLRAPYLVSLILVTALLIAVIQWLLAISRREQGIIFAEDINDLPLRRSFCYLYLPTIISVIYSFLWTWVDLDVKRLEPFFQLSKPGGATGAESILLNYPLEFLVTIPLNAFKRKHWSVLMASSITILVFWGLTPTQAGIFATRTVTVHERVNGSHATGYTPLNEQGNLTATYAQSVYNIAWLNESLPQFMTKDFVLSPFGPSENLEGDTSNSTFSGVTTLFSVDITCEPAVLWEDPSAGIVRYNGTQDSEVCSFYAPPYRINGGNDTSKPFDTMYIGYQNQDGFADYYLASSKCGDTFFHYFFVRWSKSTELFIKSNNYTSISPGQAEETSLFCKPTYYQQPVNATISLPDNAVQGVTLLGEKTDLPRDLVNISTFEWAMSSGQTQSQVRGDFPTNGFPDQKSRLEDMPLNLAYIPKMAPFAIATDQQPLEKYLDPGQLRLSYQSAYRLLFARELSEILGRNLDASTNAQGERVYEIQAVVVVPGFAYAATVLLLIIVLLAATLLAATLLRPNNLRGDPATISSLMDILAADDALVGKFGHLDSASTEKLNEGLQDLGLELRAGPDATSVLKLGDMSSKVSTEAIASDDPSETLGIRPTEMKVMIGRIFLLLQIAAALTFLALYVKSRRQRGLALPSNSTFVRQLVENYIPILIATFLEPFWLVLNRLSGLLHPFEQMRRGNAPASKSVDLDYGSLPPQLLFVRAFRATHYLLVLLCFMVLAANVLSVALSGLMYEGQAVISHLGSASPLKEARFVTLNATGLPFNTKQAANSQGDSTSEPFYRMMSNLTAGTPLPAWSDKKFAYVPMNLSNDEGNATVRIRTHGFGAMTACRALNTTGKEHYSIHYSADASEADVTINLETDDGSMTNCTNLRSWMRTYSGTESALRGIREPHPGYSAVELNSMLTSSQNGSQYDIFCRQHAFAAWVRADWKKVNNTKNIHGYYNLDLASSNTTAIVCRPSIEVVDAEIVVDREGQVQNVSSLQNSTKPLASHFSSTAADLIAQANLFLIDSDATWHNDSSPSDFNNYLIQKSFNHTFFNASAPPPPPDLAAQNFANLYRQLFAILVSTNTAQLLEDVAPSSNDTTTSTLLRSETRIFFSTPAFIVTETILLAYIFTTVLFYTRRPWRVLPRLPSTVASNIAFFAASRAMGEIGTGSEVVQEDRKTWKWGYGEFVGRDGKVHMGIEREPFVKVLGRDGMLRRRYGQVKK